MIALCSGITATVALGVGGVVYSLRQEKNGGGGDEPIDQNILPESVYKFSEDGKTLLGFKDEFLNDLDSEIYKDNFQDCDTMQIPARVTSVADSAFHGAAISLIPDYIKNLTFPVGSKCSSIGEFSFAFCLADSIKLPDSLTSISTQAFYFCQNISSMMFPSSLQTIGESAFYGCQLLTSVDFSNCLNLSSIGNYAYCMCSSLNSVSFSSSLTTIGEHVFDNCSNLSSITWNAWSGSLQNPNNTSFSGVCSTGGNVTVTNPSGRDNIDLLQYLVRNCGLPESWLPAPELPGDVYIIENNVLKGFTTGFLANPSAYRLCDTMEIPANVTSIDAGAFYNNSASTIPSFITKLIFAGESQCSTIGSHVFELSPLTSATFPDSLTTIDNNAFTGSKLTSIILPNALMYVNERAFSNCESLTSVKFSRSLKTIGDYCFENCPLLASVDLLNSRELSSIGNNAFTGCSRLTSVSFPSSLLTIGNNTFKNCLALNSVILTNAINLKAIGTCAFQNCTSLRSIDFTKPANLSSIGSYAFSGCSVLNSVILPTNLEIINNNLFADCSALTSITLSSHLSRINSYAFDSCSALTSISFPKNLSIVESSAFNNCPNLSSITWEAWDGNTNLQRTSFNGVCQTGGTVTVNNPMDDSHNSDQLLQYLLENGGLPESWGNSTSLELPDEVYNINENNVLLGFKDEFLNDSASPIYKDNFQDYNTMEIPARVTSIANNAFLIRLSTIPSFITRLTFPEGSHCSSIGENSFVSSPFVSVNLPDSLQSIGGAAFAISQSLTTVNLLNCNNLSSIGEGAFLVCQALTSIDLSNTNLITTIRKSTFSSCEAITSVKLPNNLQIIEEAAFATCSSLTSISFPSSLTTISGGNTFNWCDTLNFIAWDLPSDYETSISMDIYTFSQLPSSGKVVSLNPSITSQQLLEFLQTNGRLPSGWSAAE